MNGSSTTASGLSTEPWSSPDARAPVAMEHRSRSPLPRLHLGAPSPPFPTSRSPAPPSFPASPVLYSRSLSLRTTSLSPDAGDHRRRSAAKYGDLLHRPSCPDRAVPTSEHALPCPVMAMVQAASVRVVLLRAEERGGRSPEPKPRQPSKRSECEDSFDYVGSSTSRTRSSSKRDPSCRYR